MILSTLNVSAQGFTKSQDFSLSAPTSSTYVTLTTKDDATNAGSAGYFTPDFTHPGVGAFGVADDNASIIPNTIPVVFERQVFQANSSGNRLTFQLGQKGTFGFDDNNSVLVSISINGAAPVTALTINGPNSNRAPSFAIGGGGSSSTTYANPQTVTMAEATKDDPSLNSIGNYTIILPAFVERSTVDVTITIRAARRSTVLIDNVTITSGSPLPVELIRFAATAKGQSVNVDWATASEKNNDRFEIQRSASGEAFVTVGTVKGQGNSSSTHTYAFVDSRPLAGRSYYRLRQVDTDGTAAFSPVAAVQLRNELAMYPNPTTGQVTLPGASHGATYRILNPMGQVVLHGAVPANGRLDTSALPKGAYLLELTGAGGRTAQRLVRE